MLFLHELLPSSHPSHHIPNTAVLLLQAAVAFLSQPNPGKFSAPGYSANDYGSSMSPRGSISQSPLLGGSAFGVNGYTEVQRLKEELATNKAKLQQWEESISQARGVSKSM